MNIHELLAACAENVEKALNGIRELQGEKIPDPRIMLGIAKVLNMYSLQMNELSTYMVNRMIAHVLDASGQPQPGIEPLPIEWDIDKLIEEITKENPDA